VDGGSQFTISGLTVFAAMLSSPNEVTLTTTAHAAQSYTVTVASTLKDTLGTALGSPNSATFDGFSCTSNALVISQVYPAGGNSGASFKHDYVELHNRSNQPVSLSGMSLQYASQTASAWTNTVLPNVNVPAGGYYLVTFGSFADAGEVVAADLDGGSVNMGASAGKVALMATTTPFTGTCPFDAGVSNVIDFVGYGSANCAEGNVATDGDNNTEAVMRADNGCHDSNKNSANFSSETAAPRNLGSTAKTCSCP
jgi:predicted extracellular nuclease